MKILLLFLLAGFSFAVVTEKCLMGTAGSTCRVPNLTELTSDSCVEFRRAGTCKKKGKILCRYTYYLPVALFEVVTDADRIEFVEGDPEGLLERNSAPGFSLHSARVKHVSSCPLNADAVMSVITMLKTACFCVPSSPVTCMRSDYLPEWFRGSLRLFGYCGNLGSLKADMSAMVLGPESAVGDALLVARYSALLGANVCTDDFKLQYLEPKKTGCYRPSEFPKSLGIPNAPRKVILLWKKVSCCCPCLR